MTDVRTTITLEPDVYSLIQRRLETPGTSLKTVVNEAIRASLAPRQRAAFHTKTTAMGQPLVNLDQALQLAGQLDDALAAQRLDHS